MQNNNTLYMPINGTFINEYSKFINSLHISLVHSVYLVYNYKITNSKDWEKEIYSITYISLWVCVKMLTKLRYNKS